MRILRNYYSSGFLKGFNKFLRVKKISSGFLFLKDSLKGIPQGMTLRAGEVRKERGETIRKRVLEVWGFVDGSYLKSVDPSKVVLRTFQRGAPRYNE